MDGVLNGTINDGFNQGSVAELEELNKALGTGTEGEAYGNYNDMSALRPQSLEGTLKVVTAQEQHIKLWKEVAKKQAFNTVEEFNVLDSYGGNSSPFFVEGGLPNEEDSNYIRQSQMVKFLGTTRVITHPATLVRNTVGDIVQRETTNGTLWLLQQLERALFFANSSLDPLAFDGIETQITNFVKDKPYANQHVIDMRGKPLDENLLEDLSTIVADNFGSPQLKLWTTNQVIKDVSKLLIGTGGRQRLMMPSTSEIMLGAPVRGYSANSGDILFQGDIFLKPDNAPKAVSQKGAPAVPTTDGVATSIQASADATSLMDAGTYYYFVSAKNSNGESTPKALGSVAVTEGQKVAIEINRVTSDPVAKSYKVFRGATSDVTKALLCFEVKDAGAGTTQVIEDKNLDIPGTHKAFLLDMDGEQSFCFKQLAPLMKLPLARISASERFMILLYGMVQMYNPRRNVVIKNIALLGANSNRELFLPSYGASSYGTLKPVQG
jgi:hypothetical protein